MYASVSIEHLLKKSIHFFGLIRSALTFALFVFKQLADVHR